MPLIVLSPIRSPILVAAWLLIVGGWGFAAELDDPDPIRIQIEAGNHDRVATPVSVEVGPTRANWVLTDESGRVMPHQLSDRHQLVFRTGSLTGGSTEVLTFGPPKETQGSTSPGTVAHYDDKAVRFAFADSDLLSYQITPPDLTGTGIDPIYRRAGYLHPLKTLQGRTVTDAYPPDHLHQDGIWTAWSRTRHRDRRVDFWNLHRKTGRVDVIALDHAWDGAVEAGFSARHQFTDLTGESPESVLVETWTTRIWTPDSRDQGVWFLDLTHDQVIDGEGHLELLEHIYGGLAVRGHRDWLGADKARFLTADGIADRVEANDTRSRWCAISGAVDDGSAGLAVLDHPGNLRSPQPLRVHPEMPYFCYGPVALGALSITPDEPYRASYRIVIFDGDPDPEILNRIWNDFGDPPVAEVVSKQKSVK